MKRRPGNKEEGMCLGLVISTVEKKDENILREKTIFMEHPSSEMCTKWKDSITNYIEGKCVLLLFNIKYIFRHRSTIRNMKNSCVLEINILEYYLSAMCMKSM